MKRPALLTFGAIILLACAPSFSAISDTKSAADPLLIRAVVLVKTIAPHEIVIVADEFGPNHAGDEKVDHVFRFWSEAPLPEYDLFSRAASLDFHGNSVTVIAADHQISITFFVSDGPGREPAHTPTGMDSAMFRGYGINHRTGELFRNLRLRQGSPGGFSMYACDNCETDPPILTPEPPPSGSGGSTMTCDSGGPGSTKCSVTSGSESCTVSCGPGYYACCSRSRIDCKCIKN